MTVKYSHKLSEVLDAKIASGLLNHVRKIALFYERMHTDYGEYKSSDSLGALLKLIEKKHGLPCHFTIGASQRSTRRWEVFIFDLPELEAIELVEKKAKRGTVARKTKVKMVLDRLVKTHKWNDGHKGRPSLTREILTEDGFEKALGECRKELGYHDDQTPWFFSNIKEILDREDFDQSIYDEAWELFKVQQVMAA